ncbi:hypothetical protein U2T19_004914, partial [Salmonella enterica]|nr:hypothetical protein [Salmonella enterica]EGI1955538.1 hypothetical protein [Salmonella enterica]EMA3598565.1 hypothetical protein [Salmonella enterica]
MNATTIHTDSLIQGNISRISGANMVVTINVSPKVITGSQRDGNDLILLKDNGIIIVENFFDSKIGKKKKLLLKDVLSGSGRIYEAHYDNVAFKGIKFKTQESSGETTGDVLDGGGTSFSWIVPLIGIGAIGGLGLMALNKKKSDAGRISTNAHLDKENMGKPASDVVEAQEKAEKAQQTAV